MGAWVTLLLFALCAAILGGLLQIVAALRQHGLDGQVAYPRPQELNTCGEPRGRDLGLLCLIPISVYLLSWGLIMPQLSWAGFWVGGALCAVALVMALCISNRRAGDGQG